MALDTKRLYHGPTAVDARRWGITGNATRDQSADLAALATAYAGRWAADGSYTTIHLPGGTVRGALPEAPGIRWVGHGTTIKHPNTGPVYHLLYSLDATLPGNTAAGSSQAAKGNHFAAVLGELDFDGEKDRWPAVHPAGAAQTVTATPGTGGSLPAGDYAYAVCYKTPFGYSTPVFGMTYAYSVPANGTVALTWTNPSGLPTGAQPVIVGRAPWDRKQQVYLTALAAGTTSWTDNGSVSAAGKSMWLLADMSAPGIYRVGANQAWESNGTINIRNMAGTGYYSEWWASAIAGQTWHYPMEGHGGWVSVENCGAGGIVLDGPHDSTMSGGFVRGSSAYAPVFDACILGDWGPTQVNGQIHVWGTHKRGFWLRGHCTLMNPISEGATQVAIELANDQAAVIGGESFYPNSATAKGLVVAGKGRVVGHKIYGYSAATGAAVDLTNMGAGAVVDVQVDGMNNGTVVSLPAAWATLRSTSRVNITNTGTLPGAQSGGLLIRSGVPTTEVTAPTLDTTAGVLYLSGKPATTAPAADLIPASSAGFDSTSGWVLDTSGGTATISGSNANLGAGGKITYPNVPVTAGDVLTITAVVSTGTDFNITIDFFDAGGGYVGYGPATSASAPGTITSQAITVPANATRASVAMKGFGASTVIGSLQVNRASKTIPATFQTITLGGGGSGAGTASTFDYTTLVTP